MKVKLIYIGRNQAYIHHIHQSLPDDVKQGFEATDNHVTASGIINLYYTLIPVIIFYESDQVKVDSNRIRFLRHTFTHLYILLVTNSLSREDKVSYIKSGVNDTVPPTIKPKVLQEFFVWIEKYSALLDGSSVQPKTSLQSFKMPLTKRLFDIFAASAALIILSPLLLLVSIAIRLESKGPVIYKSKRVGSNYSIFDFWKFRSMYMDADKRLKEYTNLNQYKIEEEEEVIMQTPVNTEEKETILVADNEFIPEKEYIAKKRIDTANAFKKFEHDPRITKVGHFIRKYSIDELPQLINILKGDMSIVGNRPLPLYEAEALTADDTIERFLAPAGLTGLWQVEKRGSSGRLSAAERKELDIYYARNYSIFMDMKIILKTFTAFIQKEDV